MCRAGGRRCPSHTDPVAIAARNARRRAIYAQNKKKEKSDYFETGDDFLNKLINDPYSEVINVPADNTPTEKPKKKVASKKPAEKKTAKKPVVDFGKDFGDVNKDNGKLFDDPLFDQTQAEKDLAAKLTNKKRIVKEGTVEPTTAVKKKTLELLDMEEIESPDVSVLYGGSTVNLQTKNGQGSSGWTKTEKEYSNKELFLNKGLKKYNPDLNVEISENEGYLVDTHYLSPKKVSGVLDYTKLSEIDDSELGFNEMSEEGEAYKLNNKDYTNFTNYLELSRKELTDMDKDDKAALRYFTSDNYKWLNKSLFNKETVKNKKKADYDGYKSFNDFRDATDYNIDHQNIDSIKKITKALDKALSKGPKKQRVVYRGVNSYAPMYEGKEAADWVSENYEVGKEVVFDGYQSSSANVGPALNFSSHNGIIYEILTPEGANVSSVSEYDTESEVTLPRGQRYTVSSIHKKDIDTGYMTYNNVSIVRLVAVNSKGEVLDGTNSDEPTEITEDYFTEIHDEHSN